MLKKIVVIGPESTGKSSLCEQLAQHYGTSWCPEYAREYLLMHGKKYTYADLLTIAKGQVSLEEKYIRELSTNHKKPTGDFFEKMFSLSSENNHNYFSNLSVAAMACANRSL